ncbi:MAG TPA: GAF domain-containing protein [Acidimicrobiales bacterium]|jgi:GAF domain-containing protein|nr:GAF domain-containing protein [Acidimicrobiales bacterium]
MFEPVPDVREAIVQLSLALLTESDLQADLDRILEVAQRTVPGCEAGSVTLLVEGSPQTEAALSRAVVAIDLAQYETNEGPCLLAAALNTPIFVDVLSADERFPNFSERVADLGLQSSLSLPITIEGDVVGSLNLYAWRSSAFDATSQDMGAVLATQVGIAVAKSRLLVEAKEVAVAAQQVADESSDIAVAEGMIMVLERCSLDQAQSLMRNAASSEVKTLVVIARRVIAEIHSQNP